MKDYVWVLPVSLCVYDYYCINIFIEKCKSLWHKIEKIAGRKYVTLVNDSNSLIGKIKRFHIYLEIKIKYYTRKQDLNIDVWKRIWQKS